MKKLLVTLTVAEGKRLIAKGLLALDEVQAALKEGYLCITLGTTSSYLVEEILGEYDKNWRFIIAVGAQDDHGGGGIGEFRNVGKIASQWQGGGAERESGNCNVYDLLVVK